MKNTIQITLNVKIYKAEDWQYQFFFTASYDKEGKITSNPFFALIGII